MTTGKACCVRILVYSYFFPIIVSHDQWLHTSNCVSPLILFPAFTITWPAFHLHSHLTVLKTTASAQSPPDCSSRNPHNDFPVFLFMYLPFCQLMYSDSDVACAFEQIGTLCIDFLYLPGSGPCVIGLWITCLSPLLCCQHVHGTLSFLPCSLPALIYLRDSLWLVSCFCPTFSMRFLRESLPLYLILPIECRVR